MSKIRCELYKKENRLHKKKTAETIRMNDMEKKKQRHRRTLKHSSLRKKQTKKETEQEHPEDKQGGSRAPDFC